jgi:CTP:phosphocholine cytidylyltransferase-like protein
MNFIILGDKYQKGMKSRGCPGLIKIDSKTLLFDYQYKIIRKYFPQSQIIYVGGFESKKIENFIGKNYKDVTYIYNSKYDSLNDGYTISLVQNLLLINTFILCGYTIFDKKLFNTFDTNQGSQLFIYPKEKNPIGCIITDNKVNNISFDLPNSISNIYYLSKQDCQILQKFVCDIKYKNYFLFELMNKLIDNGVIFKPFFYNRINHKNYEYIKK